MAKPPPPAPTEAFKLHVPADLVEIAREIRDNSPETPELRPEIQRILLAAMRRGLARGKGAR